MSALSFLISWPVLLIGLVLLASLSPLLTFTWLFQLKEWRMDRLREHLRQEGIWMQLIGKTRGSVVTFYGACGLVALLASFFFNNKIDLLFAMKGYLLIIDALCLSLLTTLTLLQLLIGKQHKPIWTMKARLIVLGTILLITVLVTISAFSFALILTLPLYVALTPLWVMIVWSLLLPLDHFLKSRTFQRARLMRDKLVNPIVIGIVGSVGKTTVKELLATVLADLHPLTTPEHVNTEMGVSQWLIRQTSHSQLSTLNSQLFIIEMGAYRKGEIALLSSIIRPTIGVVTALGSDHLALFGSEEAIVEANGELIEALPPDGHAFLYGDNPSARSLTNSSPCPITLVGVEAHNDLQANAIAETEQALSFETRTRNNEVTMSSIAVPIHGTHNVGNILLAVAVARHLGITDDRIKTLLASHQSLRTTFNLRLEQGILLLDDTYNISPLSLRAAIDWANERTERPRILLTSGLLETGPEEDRFHEELGAYAKGKLERVIFTTDRGRTAFMRGYGANVELLTSMSETAPAGGALLCVGRMTPATIRRMMPRQ